MKNAVLRGFMLITVICLAIVSIMFCVIFANFNLNQTEQHLMDTLHVIDYSLNYEGNIDTQAEELDSILDSSARLTVIRRDGTVVADSEASDDIEEDNHLTRPEVETALDTGQGTNIRYSTTMRTELIYAAALSGNGEYILRLSEPYKGRLYFARALIPALSLSCILIFIISLLLSKRFANSITQPLTRICEQLSKIKSYNASINLPHCKYDEINSIIDAINTLSRRIEKTIADIHYEKKKTAYVLDNMQEGLILLDNKRNVMTINKTAMEVLGCKSRENGKNILYYTQNLEITNAIDAAFDTGLEHSFDLTDSKGRIFSINVNKVNSSAFENAAEGAIVFMHDVTGDRESENMRQEFFSNASHELKTPITSIQGYAELLTSGIKYSEEQREEFLQRINTEAGNMTGLINDILTISRLENGKNADNESPVSISLLVRDIFQSVTPMADEKHISLFTDCENICVRADYKKMYQLFNNLIVNAVKYNKPNGSVTVSATAGEVFTLKVSDTGIGIPPESQARVFERFYRVDKGRSKKTPGTGLGLAIVKHVVNYYKGSIRLESKVDVGTDITVTLPIEIIQ